MCSKKQINLYGTCGTKTTINIKQEENKEVTQQGDP